MPTEIFFQENELTTPFVSEDRIFLGEGLFETLRFCDSKPCYPEHHWQRLSEAASLLAIPFTISLKLWIEKLNELIYLKKMPEGGIKVILGGGKASRGLVERSNESHLLFNAFQYVKSTKPLKLVSATWLRDAKNPIYQLKTVNYLEAIIARRQAEATGADDVLFFNFKNQATETTIANLFIIKNNRLLTPPLKSGVLAGIIRRRLLTLCKEQGIACVETELNKISLIQADAAFTTNALQGIRKIGSCDGHVYNVNHALIDLAQELLTKDPFCHH
ncbi:MAG: aminotransferase class IV [Tatlockia sp.]|nr:aminotransferase class IV [Tatlockia sp.]